MGGGGWGGEILAGLPLCNRCRQRGHRKPSLHSSEASVCEKWATAMKGLLSLILLLVILLSSWLVAVLLDYYTGHGKPLKPHKRTNSAPFPSEKLENIFWFVQVGTLFCLASSGPVFSHKIGRLVFVVVVEASIRI